MKIQFSIRALVLACTIASIGFAAWCQGEKTLAQRRLLSAHGCETYCEYVMPSCFEHVFGFYFVASITQVNLAHLEMKSIRNRPQIIRADMSSEMFDALRGLPHLRVAYVFDDSPDRDLYNAVALELPDANVINLSDAKKAATVSGSQGDQFSFRNLFLIAVLVCLFSNLIERLFKRIRGGQTEKMADEKRVASAVEHSSFGFELHFPLQADDGVELEQIMRKDRILSWKRRRVAALSQRL